MSFHEQMRQALDRTTARLRAHLEADLAAFAEDLTRAAEAERDQASQTAAEQAAGEIRRQADAQVTQLREAAVRQADEIKRAAEAQVAEIRRTLQAQLDELRRAAQAEAEEARRTAAAEVEQSRSVSRAEKEEVQRLANARMEEVQRAAAAEIDDVRRAAAGEIETVRRATAGEIDELRQATAGEIEAARRTASAEVEEVQRRANEAVAQTRREYEAKIEEVSAGAHAQLEEARSAAHAEAERAAGEARAEAEELASAQLAVANAAADQRVQQAIDRTRGEAGQAGLAHAVQLVDAIRRLDAAGSLGAVLDALADCAGAEVERAAVFLVKGERLRGWRFAGFPDAGRPEDIELQLETAGVAGQVVGTALMVSNVGTALPPFAQSAGPRHAMALPVLVGGQVVAVLYADAPRTDALASSSRAPLVLDVLARHAGRVLEAMTVRQAAGLPPPRSVARASHGPVPGLVEAGAAGDEDAARRYARLLVSEIRMYHEPVVDAGRQTRDLRARLHDEIDRARSLYEARVPASIRGQADFFEQELVRTLADGDHSLLG